MCAKDLLARGRTNGVEGLRLLDQAELRRVEPNVAPDATGALFAPSAGIVIPFEFTIALAENAARNGVEFRCAREVVAIDARPDSGGGYDVRATHRPSRVALAQQRQRGAWTAQLWSVKGGALVAAVGAVGIAVWKQTATASVAIAVVCAALMFLGELLLGVSPKGKVVNGKVRQLATPRRQYFQRLQRPLPWLDSTGYS